MSHPIKFYRYPLSGHAHRVELMLSLLRVPHETVFVDLATGAHKQPAFLALNTFGQVPVIEDRGQVFSDSNAILVYLATQYDASGRWLPRDAAGAGRVQRWLSVAAGELAAGPARARLITLFGAPYDAESTINASHDLLGLVERALTASSYLAGEQATIADVALYSYVAHAPEGNVSLSKYPRVQAWLAQIESLPGFVPMARSAIGLQSA